MQSRSRLGLRRSWAIWECPDWRPSGLVFLGKSWTWTGTAGFGLVQTGSQSVRDQTSPTLPPPLTAQPISDTFGLASNPTKLSACFSFSLMDSCMFLLSFFT